jgi:hypothetical protein
MSTANLIKNIEMRYAISENDDKMDKLFKDNLEIEN